MRLINVSPIFDRQTAIIQSARADETHRSFECHFCPIVHFRIIFFSGGERETLAHRKGQVDCTRVRQKKKKENPFQILALLHFRQTVGQWAEHSSLLQHANWLLLFFQKFGQAFVLRCSLVVCLCFGKIRSWASAATCFRFFLLL